MNKKENLLRFDNIEEDDIHTSSKDHKGNGHIMHANSDLDLLHIFWHCFRVLYPPRCKLTRCRLAEKWLFKRRLY
jgi:hypothetical protein